MLTALSVYYVAEYFSVLMFKDFFKLFFITIFIECFK